jgi:hypothetical protein
MGTLTSWVTTIFSKKSPTMKTVLQVKYVNTTTWVVSLSSLVKNSPKFQSDAGSTSETSVNLYETTSWKNTEVSRENLKSHFQNT